MPKNKDIVFTIGHSTRKFGEFAKVLEAYGIDEVVDVRTIPKSRVNPQFNEKRLESGLKRHHIRYKHMKELGGLRHPSKDSVNTYWRNASFRGFADYMQTEDFASGIKKLMKMSIGKHIVLMCAEAVPWRCHRSLIADALTIRGVKVKHIFSATNVRDHELTPSAKVRKNVIVYK
ncbi:MAG: DUF488 domain-containing protein [Candidatus Marsarchaeota archaeon]|jgi:uncharacterized protein (DUF488 family)|nr:DUF488 domain-containing protein [Candidatus Marsarchaeota archaeon]MCL5430680.1 DUF488 domain-containing protein [Candidatus Marsarchaeota archaeon]